MTDTPKEAIKTVYRGIEMRSRAEADTARLLDLLKIEWRYEATSVLLPTGEHYRPDFSLPSGHPMTPPTWIEVRGYHSTDSDRQINAVAKAVAGGGLPCRAFACVTDDQLIGPLFGAFLGSVDYGYASACSSDWELRICANCASAHAVSGFLATDHLCPKCCYPDRFTQAAVKIVDGYVSVAQVDSWKPESSRRVRDIQDGADISALILSLPIDQP